MSKHSNITNIDTMNKSDLRSACKAAGIPYGKLTNDGMRGALRAAQATPEAVVTTTAPAVEVPAAPVTVAPVAKAAKVPKAAKSVKVPREFRNGVGRPKAGGACARVWDHLDANGDMTVADIKKWAEGEGLNTSNAAIEIYGWRKFNGIKSVKVAKQATETHQAA